QLTLNSRIVELLVSGDDANAGDLNPAVLGVGASFNIIIIMTIVYTDNTAADPSEEKMNVFEVVVTPDDWTDVACSYLEDDCVVFENEELFMFAPDAPGGFATLSLDAVNEINANTDINVIISTKCTLVCENASDCDSDLDPADSGVDFGVVQQSTFNNGFCTPRIWDDPHLTGLRGQHFDWYGEDGGWYAFLSTPDELQMNLRVTSHLPATFPERQLVTGVALVTEGGHTITADIVDPLDLAPTCHGTVDAVGSAPCLVNGGLRITVDGREQLLGAGEYHFDGDIHITAVNLPLECQRFGDYMMWGDLDVEQRLRGGSRSLRSAETVTSIFDWLVADSVMIAPAWCVKYLNELNGDVNMKSSHAVLRIETPNLSLRVNVGINTEREQTLQDGRVVPTASFWQMDVRVERADGMATAKGMLETNGYVCSLNGLSLEWILDGYFVVCWIRTRPRRSGMLLRGTCERAATV
ncbi:unnamed protein product, partial [Ectocarpus sp. 8 AP-2014]